MIPFSLRLAWREFRSGARRIGWFLTAIAMGVAALVALYGFQRDAGESSRAEARFLLGGDVRLDSPVGFDSTTVARLEALAAEGVVVSRGVSLATLVVGVESGSARLFMVNAVDSRFPVVGRVSESEGEIREALLRGGGIVADAQILRQLGVAVGERVRIGTREFVVLGSIAGLPVDFEVQWAVGPPVYLSASDLETTGLLGFGSLAQHRAWLAFPDEESAQRFEAEDRSALGDRGVSLRTAAEEARSLEAGFEELSRFLGLVGLAALVLGGIGVGSATSVYLRERRPSIAVLRCLGAGRGSLVRAYLFQTAALGAVGAGAGVLAGTLAQLSLPLALEGLLPFPLDPEPRWEGMAAGLLVGTWVAVAFSLLPLLRVHSVPPVVALNSAGDAGARVSPIPAVGVGLAVAGSVFAVSWIQLADAGAAGVVTSGLAGVLVLLGIVAWGIARGARAALGPGAPFPLRQGLSALFRPGNQTGAVVTALGLGTFLVASLVVVEAGLRAELEANLAGEEASLVLFDIQESQAEGVRNLLGSEGLPDLLLPIVPARLSAVKGRAVSDLLAASEGPSWAYRRVYRNTFYEDLGEAERLIAGLWWGGEGPPGREGVETDPRVAAGVAEGAVRVSIESDLALDLGVMVGDRITWDVQGLPVESVVASLRAVEWASFSPNFFAVFEPGALDGAPRTYIALADPGDPAAGERIQRGLVEGFPNVSFLDVAVVREMLERIAGQVVLVLRSMAGFVLASGGVVLVAALLTTRFRRRRESALLKAMGAGGRTIRQVLLSEYAAVGALAGGAGVILGGFGGAFLLDWRFELEGSVPWGTLAALWLSVLLLAVAAGWSVSGPVLRATPLSVLREEGG